MLEINLQRMSNRDLELAAGRVRARRHRKDNYEHVKKLDRARAKEKRLGSPSAERWW